MGFVERSTRVEFPGCGVVVSEPVVCVNAPTMQDVARRVQQGEIASKGGTIKAGVFWTSATMVQLGEDICLTPE